MLHFIRHFQILEAPNLKFPEAQMSWVFYVEMPTSVRLCFEGWLRRYWEGIEWVNLKGRIRMVMEGLLATQSIQILSPEINGLMREWHTFPLPFQSIHYEPLPAGVSTSWIYDMGWSMMAPQYLYSQLHSVVVRIGNFCLCKW